MFGFNFRKKESMLLSGDKVESSDTKILEVKKILLLIEEDRIKLNSFKFLVEHHAGRAKINGYLVKSNEDKEKIIFQLIENINSNLITIYNILNIEDIKIIITENKAIIKDFQKAFKTLICNTKLDITDNQHRQNTSIASIIERNHEKYNYNINRIILIINKY